jgi:hypothetical protein
VSDEFVLVSEQLGVRFVIAGDRYAHVIALGTAQRHWTLLESVEGGGDEMWPPSPALQCCNLEQLPSNRRAALLVGMAGSSHWSLAAEVIAANGIDRLVLDVACRVTSPPERLGNRYRVGPSVQWDAETRILQTPLGAARLLTLADKGETQVRGGSTGEIDFVPRRLEKPLPATIRWKFAIEALPRC